MRSDQRNAVRIHTTNPASTRSRIDDAYITLMACEERLGYEHEATEDKLAALRRTLNELQATHEEILHAYIHAGLISQRQSPHEYLLIDIPHPGYEAHQQRENVLGIPNDLPKPEPEDNDINDRP